MKRPPKKRLSAIHTVGPSALDSYAKTLAFITASGKSHASKVHAQHPLLQSVLGLENLLLSLSAVAQAVPDAADEEWNPLSQRPHAPLPPAVADELGGEITALKEAVDAFTTLSHEMMHVALWEPFFTGVWRPRSCRSFREFSLMAEGFCFFFGDIVVSGAVRTRLPDGEFALDRQTPSNARFHPIRAFQALGIQDYHEILEIYLAGFSGQRTALWQPRGTSNVVASMASQVYNFYAGSQQYLNELHGALSAFGCLSEFFRRFCAIPGLPTFMTVEQASLSSGADIQPYFKEFFRSALSRLGSMTPAQIAALRWRRQLQVRAYFALQVRWLLGEKLIMARTWTPSLQRQCLNRVEDYLEGLRRQLVQLAREPGSSPQSALAQLDADYEAQVRSRFLEQDAWSGHRWLIAPRRSGGCISAFRTPPAKDRDAKIHVLQAVAFILEELTQRVSGSKTIAARAETLDHIQAIAALGARAGQGSAAQTRAAAKSLSVILTQPHCRSVWSVPMASFDPVGNLYRELVFSYQ